MTDVGVMEELGVSVFGELDIEGEIVTYEPGQIIMDSDSEQRYVYAVIEGLAKVYTVNGRGQQYVHLIIGKGEFFPTEWLIGFHYASAVVQAIETVRLHRFDKQVLLKEIESDGAKAISVMKRMAWNLTLYASRLDNLEFKYASERLAYRLLALARRFGKPVDGGTRLPVFTNQDIGQTINLSRESVNRELSRFTRLGLIVNTSGSIVIVDHDGLRREVSRASKPLFIDDILRDRSQ